MEALLEIVKENPSIKSITFDNGKEFTRCPELENLGIKIYYAHPYSAYERGANELPIHHLIKLCKFYKVSSDYFLGLSDDKNIKF